MITIRGYKLRPGRNQVLSIQRKVKGSEFITLAEAKAHLRIDFDDENTYINTLIAAARKKIEDYTGCSLLLTEITVVMENGKPGIELPYGPYKDFFLLKDGQGDLIAADDYTLKGTEFIILDQSVSTDITMTYNAGYTVDNLPPDLKLAVLHQITHFYENRGDGSVSESAKHLANNYRRLTWII